MLIAAHRQSLHSKVAVAMIMVIIIGGRCSIHWMYGAGIYRALKLFNPPPPFIHSLISFSLHRGYDYIWRFSREREVPLGKRMTRSIVITNSYYVNIIVIASRE